jgi:hypothetical protein
LAAQADPSHFLELALRPLCGVLGGPMSLALIGNALARDSRGEDVHGSFSEVWSDRQALEDCEMGC